MIKNKSPWISKLQQTVKGFETTLKDNVNKLFDHSSSYSFPVKGYDNAILPPPPPYNRNRQGLTIVGISPFAAIFSSLITSIGITSLAFASDFMFGYAAETLTAPVRSLFMSAVVALGDVLTIGVQIFLPLDAFDPPTTVIPICKLIKNIHRY